MVIDARRLPDGERVETDLCIVGAGAAGITLAREFAGSPLRVCLIESGGRNFDRKTQSLYIGQNSGPHHWPLVQSRIRTYGGSTTAWGGRCRPLDAIDFEQRPWLPHSGWPFPKTKLDPYYVRAADVCQLPGGAAACPSGSMDKTPDGYVPLFEDNCALATVYFYYPRALDFSQMYGHEIEAADNIDVLQHANVTELITSDDAGRVTHLEAKTFEKNTVTVAARHYVLAAGGIENPRLLLASKRQQPAGLGNQHDVVGRYLMNHPHQFFAALEPSTTCPSLDAYLTPFDGSKAITATWAFSEQYLREERLVNSAVYVTPRPSFKNAPGYFAPAMHSLNLTIDALRLGNRPDDVGWHLGQMARGMGTIAGSLGRSLYDRRGQQLVMRIALESAPNPNSRITLSSQRDALGQNRARIEWQVSEIDWHSYRRMVQVLQEAFTRTGFGRVTTFFDIDSDPFPLPLQDGKHHMGATRMHGDPRGGVVDENCRVHGLANLSIAGSSLFPTGGHANPTFTIVALALRLADHLKQELFA